MLKKIVKINEDFCKELASKISTTFQIFKLPKQPEISIDIDHEFNIAQLDIYDFGIKILIQNTKVQSTISKNAYQVTYSIYYLEEYLIEFDRQPSLDYNIYKTVKNVNAMKMAIIYLAATQLAEELIRKTQVITSDDNPWSIL